MAFFIEGSVNKFVLQIEVQMLFSPSPSPSSSMSPMNKCILIDLQFNPSYGGGGITDSTFEK